MMKMHSHTHTRTRTHTQTHTHSSIWIANVAAAVAGHGTLHHLSSSPGLFRQMRVCGWQRQGIYPLPPPTSLYYLLFKFGSGVRISHVTQACRQDGARKAVRCENRMTVWRASVDALRYRYFIITYAFDFVLWGETCVRCDGGLWGVSSLVLFFKETLIPPTYCSYRVPTGLLMHTARAQPGRGRCVCYQKHCTCFSVTYAVIKCNV